MTHAMLPLLERTPVIPAVKEPETLDLALAHDGAAVFLLCGDILNIAGLVDRVHRAGKQAVVHGDLVAGLAPKEIAVDYLRSCGADGIISTRPHIIRRGRELGMLTVLRVFAIDSKAVSNLGKETGMGMPDLIEVLPGTIYRVIARQLPGAAGAPDRRGPAGGQGRCHRGAERRGPVRLRQRPAAVGPVTATFLGLEAALYAAFMTLDLTGGSGDPVKYASIAVCLAFSVLFARRGGSRLMAAAMALTLGADTFLLLLNDWYGAGVALFCGVQGLYLIRILRRCGRSLWGLRLFLVGAAWAGLWALGLLSPLNLLAAVYFANFLVNACQALSLSMPLFAWGLWLFLLCDVCVGVHNQPELFPGWLAAFAQVGMWLFYLPGQVLLVLSGRKKEDIS